MLCLQRKEQQVLTAASIERTRCQKQTAQDSRQQRAQDAQGTSNREHINLWVPCQGLQQQRAALGAMASGQVQVTTAVLLVMVLVGAVAYYVLDPMKVLDPLGLLLGEDTPGDQEAGEEAS